MWNRKLISALAGLYAFFGAGFGAIPAAGIYAATYFIGGMLGPKALDARPEQGALQTPQNTPSVAEHAPADITEHRIEGDSL